MPTARLRSRLRRLEQSLGGEECQRCNYLVLERIEAEATPRPSDGNPDWHRSEPDWTGTELERCPVCGNPSPRMSIRFIDHLVEVADSSQDD
jgi:hypothetical protein